MVSRDMLGPWGGEEGGVKNSVSVSPMSLTLAPSSSVDSVEERGVSGVGSVAEEAELEVEAEEEDWVGVRSYVRSIGLGAGLGPGVDAAGMEPPSLAGGLDVELVRRLVRVFSPGSGTFNRQSAARSTETSG